MKKLISTFVKLFIYSAILLAQPNYVVEDLKLNKSNNNEIFAFPHQNGVIFISDRRANILVNRVDTANNSLFHIYYAQKKDSVTWGFSSLLSKNIPINAHIGTCTVSSDGREIYFAASNETGQRIYSARKSGHEWTNVQPFIYSKPSYVTTHPSLSRDGKRLFFASDMQGGYGGFDIYVCERTNRGWGPPKNLGPSVNTAENELYPFIQENDVLFFSSTAHGSMGGLDIFSAREVDGEWGFVKQMEEPINSIYHDISYTSANADGTNGYFASNRTGKAFDIFSFKSIFPVFSNCQEQIENDYTYILSEDTSIAADSSTLKLMWDMGNGIKKYGDEIEYTFPSTGTYSIHLSVIDTLTSEITEQVAQYEIEVLDEEQPYMSVSDAKIAKKPVSFDASKTYLPEMNIEEYYWIFGDGTHKKGISAEHVFDIPGMYKVQLGVIGKSKHTGQSQKICVFHEIKVE